MLRQEEVVLTVAQKVFEYLESKQCSSSRIVALGEVELIIKQELDYYLFENRPSPKPERRCLEFLHE